MNQTKSTIAIVGAGPGGLIMAIALARKGIRSVVYERDQHPDIAPRFDPDRSYAIDITGHGLNALRYIDATDMFDRDMLPFNGIKGRVMGRIITDPWNEKGWTGSRGDILRSLTKLIAEKYSAAIDICYECTVQTLDVYSGAMNIETTKGPVSEVYQFIIGADGSGSIVRQCMQAQIAGFETKTSQIDNFATMIELDVNTEDLDPTFLQVLNLNPLCVAGAINGESGKDAVRWFCAVGTNSAQQFLNSTQATKYLEQHAPEVYSRVSAASVEDYATRSCFHIGKMLSCSQLNGGKAVLLGDAGAPFSPIGQGINAAMESAKWLDQEINSEEPHELLAAAQRYSRCWKPEADAVSWLCTKMVYGNRMHAIRMVLSTLWHGNVLSHAKLSDRAYTDVANSARQLWPIWGR